MAVSLPSYTAEPLRNPFTGARYGFEGSALSLGDIDGDGVPDFVVTLQRGGRIGCFSGATLQPLWLLDGTIHGITNEVATLSLLGDVDGDGIHDFMTLDPKYDSRAGRIRAISGADGEVLYQLDGPLQGTVFRPPGAVYWRTATEIGDLNGDGLLEAAVIGYDDVDSLRQFGPVVVSGGDGTTVHSALEILPYSPLCLADQRLAAAGDVNSDGVPDYMWSSPCSPVDDIIRKGKVEVFSGLSGELLHIIISPDPSVEDSFGRVLTSAGDLNGDAVPEIVAVGARYASALPQPSYHVFDGASSSFLRTVELSSPDFESSLTTAERAGDLDRDGIPDLALGFPYLSTLAYFEGAVMIVSGASDQLIADARPPSREPYAYFGALVENIDDLNHDGVPDFFVWASGGEMAFVLLSEIDNEPPSVDAGEGFAVPCNPRSDVAVTLSVADSRDPEGDPLTFTWEGPFPEGGGVLTGEEVSVMLPTGVSEITLVANDGFLDSEPDSLLVDVAFDLEAVLPRPRSLGPGRRGEDGSVFRTGSTLPLQLISSCDVPPGPDGNPDLPHILSVEAASGPLDLARLDLDAGRSQGGSLTFRGTASHWLFNLSTEHLDPGSYRVRTEGPAGRISTFEFSLEGKPRPSRRSAADREPIEEEGIPRHRGPSPTPREPESQ